MAVQITGAQAGAFACAWCNGMHVCVRMHMCVRTRLRKRERMGISVRTGIRVRVCMRMRVRVPVCMHARSHSHARACVQNIDKPKNEVTETTQRQDTDKQQKREWPETSYSTSLRPFLAGFRNAKMRECILHSEVVPMI